ncbi:MAG: methyltransferase domain-containing protein [Firmicutes bacterium]|nr:methyltransferase domain-containing protein [Bacillota bacterium]
MQRLFPNGVQLAHRYLAEVVCAGDKVIDATAGNGHDTCFLARLVGPAGKVYAFDIQAGALQRTAGRLAEAEVIDRVKLICASHEQMEDFVSEPVSAVMFNLGYLPGSDHKIITQPASTLRALAAATRLLQVGGLITVVVYPGHPGGLDESRAVDDWVAGLAQAQWDVVKFSFPNRVHHSPYLIVVQRRGDG